MGRILVRNHNNKKRIYRLWCNTSDMWMSDSLTAPKMIEFLQSWADHGGPHTYKEAYNRVYRLGEDYDKEHLEWLKEHWDNDIANLNRMDRRHRLTRKKKGSK